MLGLWWLANPSDENVPYELPDHRVSGDFDADGDGPWTLKVIGSLLFDSEIEFFKSLIPITRQNSVIWGTNTDGECLSLFDTWQSSVSWQSSNPVGGVEDWHVSWYTSGHAWVTENQEINMVSIRFDVLDDWGSEHLIAGRDFTFEDGALHLPPPRSHSASMDGISMTLHLGGELRPESGGYRASRFSSIEVADVIRLNQVVDEWVVPLQTLLEFLVGGPSRVTQIKVQLTDLGESPRRFLDLYPALLQSPVEPDSGRGQSNMLASKATLEDHGLSYSDLMSNYHILRQSVMHRTALQYICHSQSRILDQSADAEFLAVFRAAELYHGAAIGGTAIPPSDHYKRVADIVRGAPKEWKSWVRDQIADSNRKGLKRQIDELAERADDTGSSIREVWPKFARHMAEYRAVAAHGQPTSSGDIGLRFHAGSMALRWLLRHVYLLELGLSTAEANRLIQSSKGFGDDVQLLQEWQDRLAA